MSEFMGAGPLKIVAWTVPMAVKTTLRRRKETD